VNTKRENQQDATIRYLLLTSVSTCFGHYYAQLQENKGPVTAFGVLFWFCWMWLVAVVGHCVVGCEHCEGFCSIVASYWFLGSCDRAL
jgi:glycerol-3-phosphate acyltransferase PlsY